MFHGTITAAGKGLAVFWEKEWGNMNSYKYDSIILNNVEMLCQVNELQGRHLIWIQDNASRHRSKEN